MEFLIVLCPAFFFFNDTATTEIYTLSLHDALPICPSSPRSSATGRASSWCAAWTTDRKSTRLNSSHPSISYAVFCLKKKKHPHCLKAADKQNTYRQSATITNERK